MRRVSIFPRRCGGDVDDAPPPSRAKELQRRSCHLQLDVMTSPLYLCFHIFPHFDWIERRLETFIYLNLVALGVVALCRPFRSRNSSAALPFLFILKWRQIAAAVVVAISNNVVSLEEVEKRAGVGVIDDFDPIFH